MLECGIIKKHRLCAPGSVYKHESLVQDRVGSVVAEEPEVRFIQLVEFSPRLNGHRAEPIGLPAAGCEVPVGGGELHHIVHPQLTQQVLGVLLRRLQVADKVILNLARMAKPIHLPPVLVKGHLLLRLRVQEVLDEVGEGGMDAHAERLLHRGRRRRLIGVAAQHDLRKASIEVLVRQLEFIPVGRDEADEGVPHKYELCVLLELHLHEVLGKLAVAFPELVEGKVHAAVVDQVSGDGQRVSLGNTVPQQAFTEDNHDAFPVAARYLGDIAVDNTMPVIHNKVIQLLVGNVVKRTVLARKRHAVISAHLLK